jgi:hypothetical protein
MASATFRVRGPFGFADGLDDRIRLGGAARVRSRGATAACLSRSGHGESAGLACGRLAAGVLVGEFAR